MVAPGDMFEAIAATAPQATSYGRRATGLRVGSHAVAVLRTRADFEALAGEWQALEASCTGALFFQSAGWVRTVFDFEAERGNAGFDPVIVTLHDADGLKAILPLERIRTRLRTMLVPLGDRYSQISDALVADDLPARDTLAPMLKAAIAAAPADLVSLQKVRAGSRLAAGLGKPIKTGEVTGAPFENLTDWADFDAYFQSIRTKTRKNMRSSRNRLSRDGVLEHHVVTGGEGLRETILRTIIGRAGRLEEQGLTSRSFSDPAFAAFCSSLVDHPDVQLMAMSLTRNGEPLSEQWGFVHNQRYYIFMTTRDFGSSEESPGKLHMKDVMEVAFAKGLKTVDFMTPIMPYKLTWCRQVTEVNDYALPITLKGVLSIHLWDKAFRPFAKHVFSQLPQGFRQAVMKGLGR
jgi:CelD/BcsL family acetyltransferase involved in cellulose biosynthesis